MPSANKPHHRNRYPANATLRCVRCGRTGITAAMFGHTGRGACQGAELSLVRVEIDPPATPAPAPAPPVLEPGAHPFTVPDPAPPPPPSVEPPPPPPPSVEPPPPPPTPEGPPLDDLEGDDLTDDDLERMDEEDRVAAEDEAARFPDFREFEVPTYRPVNPRARPVAVRAAAGAGVSDFWRPVQLTPETHVYYRMACTDPAFAERFGGLFQGTVVAFVDQIVHAFFVLNLRHGLGLAALDAPEDDDQADDERPLTVGEFRDLFAELMGSASPEEQRARATQNAGAA